MRSSFARLCAATTILISFQTTQAHGVVGDRFFPATLATDDPFAADELALPTVTLSKGEVDYDLDWSKSIVSHVAVAFGGTYVNRDGGPSGWDNVSITPIWQFLTDPEDEFVMASEVSLDLGGTGAKSVADRFSTYTPQILFGKGFGGLPETMAWLRPLALTGDIGLAIPGTSAQSKAVQWSGALEYSLLYLQSNVHDAGLPPVLARLTPVVEASFTSPVDSGGGGTTGTINPGLIWSGQYTQFALEATIPVNGASGNTVGAVLQFHVYLDDVFPKSVGAPIWGGGH